MIYGNKYDFIYKLFNTDNQHKRIKRKRTDTFQESLKYKKNNEISELRISINPVRQQDIKIENISFKKKNKKFVNIKKSNKRKKINPKLKQAKSHKINHLFVGRMAHSILILQNQEMCILHLSNNLIKEDINNRRINQNFKVIWDYINKQFKHSIDALNELKLTKTKKFKRHVLNKLARVNYIENEVQYPEQHINRVDYILSIIQTDKVLIRHKRKEIVKKRFLSSVTRRFSNDRNAVFDEESESRSSLDSNQTRSINEISVSFTIESEESNEEN